MKLSYITEGLLESLKLLGCMMPQQFTLLMPKDSEFSMICLKVCKQSGNEGIGIELGDRVYSLNSFIIISLKIELYRPYKKVFNSVLHTICQTLSEALCKIVSWRNHNHIQMSCNIGIKSSVNINISHHPPSSMEHNKGWHQICLFSFSWSPHMNWKIKFLN